MPSPNPRPYTVLLTRFSALGDVAMTVPVVYAAARAWPGTRFVMVTRMAFVPLFVNPPDNLEIFGVDLKAPRYRGPLGSFRLGRDLWRQFRPDAFGDLHNVLRTKIVSLVMRAHGAACAALRKQRSRRRALTRPRNKVMLPLPSQRQRFREVFGRLNRPASAPFAGLYEGPCKAADELFASIAGPRAEGEVWIGIAPFAAHPGKVYPVEKMEKVVAQLQSGAPSGRTMRIFLFGGGKAEAEILDRWEQKYPCAVSLAGRRLGFAAELALMNHCQAFVAMDSGNMHLAAMAGTKVVSVWGATHPFGGFTPWNQPKENRVEAALPCRPCSAFGALPCRRGDHACMAAIRPEEIIKKVIALLP